MSTTLPRVFRVVALSLLALPWFAWPPSRIEAQTRRATPERDPEPTPTGDVERLLLLTPAGPLLWDCLLTIDDAPHHRAREKLLADSFVGADADKNGVVAWDELLDGPNLGSRLLRHLKRDRNRPRFIGWYDANKNGVADLDEARALFSSHLGGGALTVDTVVAQEPAAPPRKALDPDGDGALTAADIDGALDRLRTLDADGNGVLERNEWTGPRPAKRSEYDRDNPLLFHLNANTRWSDLHAVLVQRVGRDKTLPLAAWRFDDAKRARLDANGNGLLDADECAGLLAAPAHVVLEARLGVTARADRFTVSPRAFAGAGPVSGRDPTFTFSVGAARVRVNVGLSIPAMPDPGKEARSLLAARDRDRDGVMTHFEALDFEAYFLNWDENGDGRATLEELTSWQDRHARAEWENVGLAAVADRDALLCWLDDNGDHRLSARELAGAAARLRLAGVEADGSLRLEKIPPTTVLGVSLSRRADAALRYPMARPNPTTNLPERPVWFLFADANRDDDVSRGEFRGTDEEFAALDVDRDGFVDLREAAARNQK